MRSPEWEDLLAAKLVMRRGLMTDTETTKRVVRQAILETDEEDTRCKGTTSEPEEHPYGPPPPPRRALVHRDRPKHGATTGLTKLVGRAFADSKVHLSKDLQKQFDVSPQQMKKALGRLKDQDLIKHTGKKGSGAYVRVSPRRGKSRPRP